MHAPLTDREQEIVTRACGALSDVPNDVQKRLEGYAKQIDKAKRSIVADGFRIGDLLIKARDELANHGNGTFGVWVSERCGFSIRSAQRYMSIAATFNGGDRDSLSQSSTLEAISYLARDTTPEDAIADAIDCAKSGGRVDLKAAKAMVRAHAPEQEESEPEELDIFEAARLLESAMVRVGVRWPQSAMATLADKLESIAAEIREHGTLWQLREVADAS